MAYIPSTVDDELVVTCIDRLARSIGDRQDIVRSLKTKGATRRRNGQGADLLETRGWDDRAGGVIEV